MSMHKDDVLKIQEYLKTVTVSGKEAVAYATAFGLMNNELSKLGPNDNYIEYTNIPGHVWSNVLALLERAQMLGKDVQSYIEIMGKVQMAASTTKIIPVKNDADTVDADTVAQVTATYEEESA